MPVKFGSFVIGYQDTYLKFYNETLGKADTTADLDEALTLDSFMVAHVILDGVRKLDGPLAHMVIIPVEVTITLARRK